MSSDPQLSLGILVILSLNSRSCLYRGFSSDIMSLLLLFCLFSQSKKFLVAETKKSMEVEKVR